jgi:hypothetical protein
MPPDSHIRAASFFLRNGYSGFPGNAGNHVGELGKAGNDVHSLWSREKRATV